MTSPGVIHAEAPTPQQAVETLLALNEDAANEVEPSIRQPGENGEIVGENVGKSWEKAVKMDGGWMGYHLLIHLIPGDKGENGSREADIEMCPG